MSTDDGSGSSGGPAPNARPTVPVTALFVLALGLTAGCVLMRWMAPQSTELDAWTLDRPVATAVRVLEIDLAIDEALVGSRYESLCDVFLGLSNEPIREVIDAYGDMLATSASALATAKDDPERIAAQVDAVAELRLRRIVLLGEAGRRDEAQSSLEALDDGDPALRAALRSVYALGAAARIEERPAALDRWQPGWARERLELRIAEQRGVADAQRATIESGRATLRTRLERLTLARAIPTLLGLAALCAWLLRNRPPLVQSTASVPPAWSWQDGYAVLLISALAGLSIDLVVVLAAQGLGAGHLAPWAAVVASIPMIVWMRSRLLRPNAQTFGRALGLTLPGSVLRWTCVFLALFAASEIGSAAIDSVSRAVGAQEHWSRVVSERLLWSSRTEFALWSIDLAVWRPIIEEIGFRGLVYLTFRRRFGPVAAALMCAGLFAAIHPVSFAGQLSIIWKGLVLAAGVELTKSLVPAMACHAFANALALVLISGLYR